MSKVLTLGADAPGMRLRLSSLVPLLATAAFASPGARASGWSTATHFGLNVEDGSSTGYEKVAGSMFFLDVVRGIGDDFEVGLRTIGQGGKTDGRQFNRLGAGPLVSWNINESWRLQAAVGAFDETGQGADGAEEYRSKGRSEFLGWNRRFAFGKKVEFGYGGFLTRYQGNLRHSDTSAASSAARIDASHNAGFGHGIAGSLKIQLD